MNPKTTARIRNMDDQDLRRTINRVRKEEGQWHNEGVRRDFLADLEREEERRIPED